MLLYFGGHTISAYFSYYSLPWEVVARYANVLYMLFFASCIHSLKKSQLETKRVGNTVNDKLTTARSLSLCCSLVFVKKLKKLKEVSLTSMQTTFFNTYDICKQFILSF